MSSRVGSFGFHCFLVFTCVFLGMIQVYLEFEAT